MMITADVLLKVKTEIFKPLKHIFNLCLKTGLFPEQLKIAKLTPIF